MPPADANIRPKADLQPSGPTFENGRNTEQALLV